MNIVGFERDSLGHFRIILTQPFIKGKELTNDELNDFHKKYQLTQSGPWFSSADKSVLITDLSPSNIIKDKDGNYFVIDADVVYNTAARGVRVTFENSLTLNTTANQSNTTELSLA